METAFAKLSQRIKKEADKFSGVSGDEIASLSRFVACQTVRTLALEQCIQEQAGGPVDRNTVNAVIIRKMKTMTDAWIEKFPTFRFHTPLPLIGDHFITGDHPVMIIQSKQNEIWLPVDMPSLQNSDLSQLLQNPSYGFWISLSPYICASIQGYSGNEPRLPPETMDLRYVRQFNEYIRGQCKIFTLARDRESL